MENAFFVFKIRWELAYPQDPLADLFHKIDVLY